MSIRNRLIALGKDNLCEGQDESISNLTVKEMVALDKDNLCQEKQDRTVPEK